jgi:hypothetical protein
VSWGFVGNNQYWSSVSLSATGQYQTAVGNNAPNQINVSTNFGSSWATTNSPSLSWTAVSISSSGQYQTAVVNGGKIYVSIDFGNTWTATGSILNWSSVSVSASGKHQTAVVNGGQIWISNTIQAHWTLTGNQLYPTTLTNNVGIGTTGATGYALDISGNMRTNADALINGLTVGLGGANNSSNIAFGYDALVSNTTGDANVAIGREALLVNTNGQANVAIGLQALIYNTSGSSNVAIGSSNIAINSAALYNNTEGNYNIGIGQNSLIANTTGSYNVGLGASTGSDLSGNSNYNTFLGNFTNVFSNTLIYNNSTAVGYNAIIDASNQMVLGGLNLSSSYPNVKIPGSYVGIGGVYNPASGYALDVSGNANIAGNFNILQSSYAQPMASTTQLGYTFNSSVSTIIPTLSFVNLVTISSVSAGVYMVTAQSDVNYSSSTPSSSSWLRLSLNTSNSFNSGCVQDYYPAASPGNFYIRITGIFTLSSSSNIYVGGQCDGTTPNSTSTVLSYTRIG